MSGKFEFSTSFFARAQSTCHSCIVDFDWSQSELQGMLQAAKHDIRRRIRLALKSLPIADRQRQSADVCSRVISHPAYQSSRKISIFISMPHELQTRAIFEHAFSVSKAVFVPVVLNEKDMIMVSVTSMADIDAFPKSAFGVPEPPLDSIETRSQSVDFDLVIVPGIAFDQQMNRLGQGRGFYDRFIQICHSNNCRPSLLGVGLAQQFIESELPHNQDDVQMTDIIIAGRLEN
jgi:5-formyltetrahydrofolate cyclo-ligase